MLTKADPVFESVPIYVSSEYMKNKLSGNLFRIVAKKENAVFSCWEHFGDHPIGDIDVPEKMGITVKKYKFEKQLEIEQAVITKDRYDPTVQLMAGAARNARLFSNLQGSAAIGAGVSGPVFYSYVSWLIQEALNKGITRLYFIARDGYVLKQIADVIIKKCKYTLQTEYIYGSRKAWRMASVNSESFDVKLHLNWSYVERAKKVKEIADIFQISEDELLSFIPKSRNGKYGARDIQLALDTDRFRDFLIKKHEDKRKTVQDYLIGHVDISDDKFAFVELVGSGFTQECLAEIMKDFYPGPIRTFFFEMDAICHNPHSICFNYLPGRTKWLHIVEALDHAPHGQTSGYEIVNGEIVPVLENIEDETLKEYGIDEYISGISSYAEEYTESIRCIKDDGNDSMKGMIDYIRYIAETPDDSVKDFLGDIPFSVTGRERKIVSFAPKLSNCEIVRLFLKYGDRDEIERHYRGTSLDFALTRCSDFQKHLINYCKNHSNSWLGSFVRGIDREDQGDVEYPLPERLLGRKVVIYAAGIVGRSFYKQLMEKREYKVVLWVDSNWENLNEPDVEISAPEKILDTEFDTVLVAILNNGAAASIRNRIIAMGVAEEKIVTEINNLVLG
ncbi:MAG: hypothetical protein K6E34_02195 [Lachnospiraceae bacterium]|nr:hypothetical protein [Lachnospiraceae bacterium]